jgi:hypothetical protein
MIRRVMSQLVTIEFVTGRPKRWLLREGAASWPPAARATAAKPARSGNAARVLSEEAGIRKTMEGEKRLR